MPPRQDLYNPVPTVSPEAPRRVSEQRHIDFPRVEQSGALGQAMQSAGRMTEVVGHATGFLAQNLDQAGRQFEHAGNEIFQRAMGLQQLQNETAAKKAAIEYDTYADQKQVEFSQKQGEAANEASLKAHMDDLKQKREQISAKMGNTASRTMFDNSTIHSMLNGFKSAATHAATETRKAANGASEARINNLSDQFSKTDDIAESDRLHKEAYSEFYGTKVPLSGWSADQAKEEWIKIEDKMYGSKIVRLSHSQPGQAMKMLEENKDKISGPTYTKLLDTVTDNLRDQQSRNIAERIQKADPEAPLEDKLEKAEKEAKEVNKDDFKLPDATRQRLTALHNIDNKERAERKQKNIDTAKSAAYGYGTPSGALPTSKEDLYAIPGAREAYDALPAAEKHAIDNILEKNSQDKYPETPATIKRVDELKREAQSPDPAEREKFRHRDFADEKIPLKDRTALYALRREAEKKALSENPSVQRARRVAGDLLPNNIRHRQGEGWKEFDATLQAVLERKIEENKGVPLKDNELREVVSQLLQNDPNTGWYGWFQSQRFENMRNPSDNDLMDMKNQFPGYTDDQLKDLYAQSQWRKLQLEYNKLKTKTPAPTAAPKPSPVPASK